MNVDAMPDRTPSQGPIPLTEIRFNPESYADPNGRVFVWRGQLYRGISAPRAAFYRSLFQQGIIQELIDQELLVKTELTDLTLEGYSLVLRHERVPFVTYPFNWCGEMLRDAGLRVVKLEQELCKQGLTLQDAHSYNVLFDGPNPRFIDFGSIVRMDPQAPGWPDDEFCRFFVNPLRLAACDQGRIARALLLDDLLGVLPGEVTPFLAGDERDTGKPWRRASAFIPARLRSRAGRVFRRLKRSVQTPSEQQAHLQAPLSRLLEGHRESLSSLALPPPERDGVTRPSEPLTPSASWTARAHTIARVLSELKPATVLDLQPQDGWFALMAARLGARTVTVDEDEARISRIYRAARRDRLPILPLVMSIFRLSRPLGQLNHRKAIVAKRLVSDMVFAGELVPQLVGTHWLDFHKIARLLSEFSRKWVLVEWLPAGDPSIGFPILERYPSYQLDQFRAALLKRFAQVELLLSHPQERAFLLCTKH